MVPHRACRLGLPGLALCFFLLNAASIAHAGSVCGTVRDRLSSQPVPRAGVFLFAMGGGYTGLYAATDAVGAYCLTGVPAGTYDVLVRVDDYLAGVLYGVIVNADQTGIGIDVDPTARLRFAPPWPNPAHTHVLFRFDAPGDAPLRLQIVDATGRLIRGWAGEAEGLGERTLTWDFRDHEGRIVAPGIYFARLTDGRAAVTRRIVFLP